MESIRTQNMEEAMPFLQSLIGKLSLTSKETLVEVFEQKQISTECIISLLPVKSRKGSIFYTTLSDLSKIFNEYGIAVKYVTKGSISYRESNNLSLAPNLSSVTRQKELPKSLVGSPKKRSPWSVMGIAGKSFDLTRIENSLQTYFEGETKPAYYGWYSSDADWYLNSIMRHKLLDKDITYQLIRQAHEGDLGARNTLIVHNQRLIVHIMNKIYRVSPDAHEKAIEFSDLVQEGSFGLSKAIDRFDLSLNLSFSTYAYWWVTQSIQRAIHDYNLTIRLPVHISEKLAKFQKILNLMESEANERPSIKDVALRMGTSSQKVFDLERINFTKETSSIDFKVYGEDEDMSLGDFISDVGIVSPAVSLDQHILREKLRMCLKRNLSIKEYEIIDKRFGLSDNVPLKLREIGERFGVTRERIRQIEGVAIERIKNDTPFMQFAKEYLGKEYFTDGASSKAKIDHPVVGGDRMLLITSTISKFYMVSVEDIFGETRKEEVVLARHVLMYLLWKNAKASFSSIARRFHDMDHTSIRHACLKIQKELLESKSLESQINFLTGLFSSD